VSTEQHAAHHMFEWSAMQLAAPQRQPAVEREPTLRRIALSSLILPPYPFYAPARLIPHHWKLQQISSRERQDLRRNLMGER